MAKFKTIITTAGAAKIAAVLAGTGSIVLDNTAKMAVGDGGGTLPNPDPAQTKLVNEVHRAPINRASIDASDPKNIVAELVIPPSAGGFWIREMALYDAAGTLLAVGNLAETYKPSLNEGAGRKMVIRMVIAVSEVSAITITMDTTTVMASQDYVDNELDKHAKSRNHPDATLTAKGFTQLSNDTSSSSETQAATPKAVKAVMDETKLKAPIESPALAGKPTAPTAAPGTNNTQISTTAFVQAAIAALVNSSPAVLDTLGELAASLGNDANFATTMANALGLKAPLQSPVLTGTPTAPTAAAGNNTTQLATTAFVQAAITALINSSPEALNTLKELADALGNDANFATTMANALAGKQPKDNTLTSLSGKDVAGLVMFLGLSAFHSDQNFTSMSSPTGKTFIFITDSGNWGVQDSAGNPLPLDITNGGTGANTLLGARVELGVASFGSDKNRSTMSSPGATAFVFIDKNGDWGALDKDGKVIPLPLSRGGLGATDAAGGRTALELGSAATKSVGTGAGQIPDMSAFQVAAVAKGYERQPNGLLRQWGTITIPAANGNADVGIDSFAIPFPNGVLNCRVNGVQTLTDTPCFASGEAIDRNQIRIKAVAVNLPTKAITQGMAVTVSWEAIGA